MPENTIASKTFDYKLPNKMFDSSDSDGLTASATYNGPDKVYVFVDTDGDNKGKRIRSPGELTERDEGADVPVPVGTTRVEVTLADDPLMMAIFRVADSTIVTNDQTTVTETYGDYTIKYNGKPEIGETYVDESECVYDLDAKTWSAGYKTSPVDWDDIILQRDSQLEASDGKISPDMPDAVKTPWVTYRQALRDLPTVYKKGESDEVEAWKVEFPLAPDTKAE
ncbi:MAG: hypothetical protein CMG35_11895 [Candidatus Marinimicrobia bacterium]|nr:hypothetical protein [Candidatus Neomarinimicrobiota bacterium]MBO03333.1 hypothetical protein [Candidatus Neomarinimicrobiota bacterium]|tara:strand:+ start:17626 stop:18297 length:672 start_codon:yes stop_codon:yes gene_type:complete